MNLGGTREQIVFAPHPREDTSLHLITFIRVCFVPLDIIRLNTKGDYI